MTIRTQSLFSAALVLLTCASLSLPMPAQAQKSGSAQTGASSGLSTDQKSKVQARQRQFQKDVAALRADTKLSDVQKQAKYQGLYAAMDTDMLAILTPAQRTRVLRQRQINAQFQQQAAALQADKTLTAAQKKARYTQIVQAARDASLANMPPAQRAATLKRVAEAQKKQQQRVARVALARQMSQQLQKSETPAQSKKISGVAQALSTRIQSVIGDKTLSDQAKTQRINSLREDAQAQDIALLTPPQRALYARIQALIASISH